MKKFLLLISLTLVVWGCRNQKEQEDVTPRASEALSQPLKVDRNRTVKLTPEALDQVGQWLAYATAQNEIQALRNRSGEEIVRTASNLMQIMEELHTSMPDTLRTPATQSRTNVLLTKSQILYQMSLQKEKDPKKIFDLANDLLLEFDNFKLQLNELFLKTPTDFESELDAEFDRTSSEDTLPPPLGRE